jgi:hypothetical protein
MKTFQYFSVLLLTLFLLSPIHSKPSNSSDKQITILYMCNLGGYLHFDEDGRKGLATIAEIKRRETEKLFSESGGVLLISQGKLFEESQEIYPFSILKTALFDSVFLTESELSYIEKNPTLIKLDLPILANRESYLEIQTEKIFSIEGIKVRVQKDTLPKFPHDKKEHPHLNLVFPEDSSSIEPSTLVSPFPVFYFLPKEKTNSISYKKNVYTAECPESGEKIGKLKLTFRKEELIRQYHEFIPLNTKDHNNSWIKPHSETVKELQKN